MSRRYAADTTVSVEKTQVEISTLLARHGAGSRAIGADDATGRAAVMFAMAGRRIRVEVLMHPTDAAETDPRGWRRWTEDQRRRWTASQREQRERATWRGLLLLLRAKLERLRAATRRSSASSWPMCSCRVARRSSRWSAVSWRRRT